MSLQKVGTFVLTDESIDAHSERVLVKGVNLSRFNSNPVMLYNHMRSTPGFFGESATSDTILPIGRWKNVQKDDDRIVAEAWIDMEDPFAAKIGKKIENGILNAVSIGFRALAVSDAEEDKVQGQKGVTITKAELMEASIVDVPANPNATVLSKVLVRKDFEGGAKEVEGEKNFVKFYNQPEKKKTMAFNFIEWLKGAGKPVPQSEEEAKALLGDQNNEEISEIKSDFTSFKASVHAQLSDLADKVSALAGKVSELSAKEVEEEDAAEKEVQDLQTKMDALAEQIAAIKTRKSGNQIQKEEAPGIGSEEAPEDKEKGKIKGAVNEVLSLIK